MQKAKAIPVDRANEVGFDSSDDETKIKQDEAQDDSEVACAMNHADKGLVGCMDSIPCGADRAFSGSRS